MSPDTAIDILPEAVLHPLVAIEHLSAEKLLELLDNTGPLPNARQLRDLRLYVEEDWADGIITTDAILRAYQEECVEKRRLAAANRIIAEQNHALAKAHTILSIICANARIQPDASMNGSTDIYAVPIDDIETASQWLVGAMLRDRREGVR